MIFRRIKRYAGVDYPKLMSSKDGTKVFIMTGNASMCIASEDNNEIGKSWSQIEMPELVNFDGSITLSNVKEEVQ